MQINSAMLSLIDEFLTENPLGKDEIVRVKGLGERYIAYADVEVPDNHKLFLSFEIRDVEYALYVIAPASLSE